MASTVLGFNVTIGKTKPENIIHTENACPFCDRDHLTDILDTDGDIILLKNKYQVIDHAEQFVIIEGKECHSDIPTYTREHMHRLIAFGMKHWHHMLHSEKYRSVLFFKNFGPYSGGTIRHPHMQLVGLPAVSPDVLCTTEIFEGLPVAERNGTYLNVSTKPRVGFLEINILPTDDTRTLADFIQYAVDFFMNHFSPYCQSYNIFFYKLSGKTYVKIMPRFATSPIFIGYDIHFRPNNLEKMADKIRQHYFSSNC